MAQFLNTKETLVTEAIDGLLASLRRVRLPVWTATRISRLFTEVGLGQVEGRAGIRWRVWSRTRPCWFCWGRYADSRSLWRSVCVPVGRGCPGGHSWQLRVRLGCLLIVKNYTR